MIKPVLFILILIWTAAPLQAATTLSPNNMEIRYTGRWDHSSPEQPWSYWIGSSITAKFTGTRVSATLSASNTDYIRIIIDNDAAGSVKIPVTTGQQTYDLATGLPNTGHTVEIIKETDAGRLSFHQMSLDDGASLEPLPPRPSRRITFYGDSNLAGDSLESEQNGSARSLRGSYYGYAGIAARMFGSEYENISRSGASIRSLNNAFDRIDYRSRNPSWDFGRFQPHLVVVNLGANDVGRPKNRIKSYYHAFLNDLRAAYPSAHIMLFNAWGWDYNEPANYIHEVIDERSDSNMSWAVFPWIFEQWHGCEYDHAGMAQVLAEHLEIVMGWTPGIRDVMSGLDTDGGIANGGFEQVAPFGGYGWRYFTDTGVSRVYAPGGAHGGDYYLQLSDGAQSHQPVPANDGDTVVVTAMMRASSQGQQLSMTVDFRDQNMWTTPLQSETSNLTLTNEWQEYTMTAIAPVSPDNPVYHTRLTFTAAAGASIDIDDVTMTVTTDTTDDTDPPSPDPLTWDVEPMAISGSEISMTATTATDISSVEYKFECVLGNCNGSNWQSSPSYTDTGLLPGTEYSYRGQARDLSGNQNVTGFTTTESATTLADCSATHAHVDAIDATVFGVGQGRKSGRAVVEIHDNCGAVVNGASVTGTFTGDFNEPGSANTNGSGIAVIETEGMKKGKVAFDFCVDAINSALLYDEGSNIVTCASN